MAVRTIHETGWHLTGEQRENCPKLPTELVVDIERVRDGLESFLARYPEWTHEVQDSEPLIDMISYSEDVLDTCYVDRSEDGDQMRYLANWARDHRDGSDWWGVGMMVVSFGLGAVFMWLMCNPA